MTKGVLAPALAALLLAAHAGLAIDSMRRKSVTYDEVSHLPAGLAMAATGEHRLNRQHPPLVKLLAGLSASTAGSELPLSGDAYRERREWDFGRQVLFESGNDDRALLFRGRLPVVLISVLGGALVFCWSWRRFGAIAGLTSLGLYAFSPTVLAHARLVTMDVAMATFSTATLYFFWRAARDPALGNTLKSGAGLGLAMATKFSGLVLLPAMALSALVARWLPDWRRRLLAGLILLGVALVVLAASYLWPLNPVSYFHDAGLLYFDLPEDYSYYLAGEFSDRRFPHYFLVAVAVKSSLPSLLAMLAGLATAVLVRDRWRDDVYLWLPVMVWTAATSLLATNQGVRYLLPVYPLLFVLAGSAIARLRTYSARAAIVAAILVVSLQAREALANHPDYLPYFHQAAGGTAAGPRWLDDSNLDWSQDLGRLPAWLEEKGIERVRLVHFGANSPEHYGVRREPFLASDFRQGPRPGAYVVSAHVLVRWQLSARTEGVPSDWLDRYQPVDVLGGSLYLYVFPPDTGKGGEP